MLSFVRRSPPSQYSFHWSREYSMEVRSSRRLISSPSSSICASARLASRRRTEVSAPRTSDEYFREGVVVCMPGGASGRETHAVGHDNGLLWHSPACRELLLPGATSTEAREPMQSSHGQQD